jgi:light-regulated signal transduction histidine kinase (bacteriophytochrome)
LNAREREISVLNTDLSLRAAQLEAANKELEAFSYSVSHDLRSPLRAIDSYTTMLEEDLADKLDEASKRLLNLVHDSSRRMGILIDELLEFSRVGRQSMSVNKIDMTAAVSEAWSEIRIGSPQGAPDFKVQTLPTAWGDRTFLKQVWTNLLSNALKFSGKMAGPRIEVSGEEHGAEMVYCVRDNGVGFDMQYYNKLFEVFQRLHSERDFSGTGVGLAIVQRVVTRHGGRVWAEGKVNAGAAFFFSLPTPKTEVLS